MAAAVSVTGLSACAGPEKKEAGPVNQEQGSRDINMAFIRNIPGHSIMTRNIREELERTRGMQAIPGGPTMWPTVRL